MKPAGSLWTFHFLFNKQTHDINLSSITNKSYPLSLLCLFYSDKESEGVFWSGGHRTFSGELSQISFMWLHLSVKLKLYSCVTEQITDVRRFQSVCSCFSISRVHHVPTHHTAGDTNSLQHTPELHLTGVLTYVTWSDLFQNYADCTGSNGVLQLYHPIQTAHHTNSEVSAEHWFSNSYMLRTVFQPLRIVGYSFLLFYLLSFNVSSYWYVLWLFHYGGLGLVQ